MGGGDFIFGFSLEGWTSSQDIESGIEESPVWYSDKEDLHSTEIGGECVILEGVKVVRQLA